MNTKLSLVLFTHNSQDKLRLSRSFLECFDELVAIDDGSIDRTVPKLKTMGFRVINSPFDGDFAARHNLGTTKSRNDWVFFLDDDEYPDETLINHLKKFDPSVFGAFGVRRKDVAWGKLIHYGEQGSAYPLRLVNKSAGTWVRKVHEYFKTNSKTGTLSGSLIHDQDLTVESFLTKANFYAPIDAAELLKEGKRYSRIEMLKPKAKFIQNYIFRLGFLDGYRGLFLAYLMSLQSFMVRIYQWELQN